MRTLIVASLIIALFVMGSATPVDADTEVEETGSGLGVIPDHAKAPKLNPQPVSYGKKLNIPAYGYIEPEMRQFVWSGYPTSEMGNMCETTIRFGQILEPALKLAYSRMFSEFTILSSETKPRGDAFQFIPKVTSFRHIYENFATTTVWVGMNITTRHGNDVAWSKDYMKQATYPISIGCGGLTQEIINKIGGLVVEIMVEHAKNMRTDPQMASLIESIEGGGMQAMTEGFVPVDTKYRVVVGNAAVRVSPKPESFMVDTFPLGSLAHVIGTLPNGWMQVAREGKPLGWVHRDSLREEAAVAAVAPSGAIEPRSVSRAAKDSAAWEKIKFSNNVSDFQRYLKLFPNGMFVKLAESQMRDLILRQTDPQATKSQVAGIEFGSYHALIIGINDYKHLPKLKTAVKDAKSVGKVLEETYGFKVTILVDAERADIVDALDEYRETLGPDDNLLIYYAGHGWLDEETDEGYWLTRSAKSNRRSRWVSNAVITNTLKGLSAKHVMVVADSCYSGTLTRSASVVGFRDKAYYRRMASKHARVAMVSGGLEPVADDSGKGNSPFASAFLDALHNNTDVMDGTRLFSEIRRPVILNANQTPQYSDVRDAGHDGGDFLFVRKR